MIKIITLLFLYCIYKCNGDIGYNNYITIGTNDSIVGINLNESKYSYPLNGIYNINNPNDPVLVHSALQEAINYTSLNGGTVYITKGTYVSITQLEIYGNNVHLKGDGIDKTIIILADYAPPFIYNTTTKAGFVRSHYTSDIIISNMTIDGNKQNQYNDSNHLYGRYGIFTEGCMDIWFDNIKVTNFQGYGFDPHGWKKTKTWGNYLTITNCISENNNWDGFTIDQTYYVYIDDCVSYNNRRHGYNIVTGSKYVYITNSYAINNGLNGNNGAFGCGFTVQNNFFYNTSDVTMINNTLITNEESLCLNDVFNINFTRNYIKNSLYCFNLILINSSYIYNNTCYADKFLLSNNTNIINSIGSGHDVYIYNNYFNMGIPLSISVINYLIIFILLLC